MNKLAFFFFFFVFFPDESSNATYYVSAVLGYEAVLTRIVTVQDDRHVILSYPTPAKKMRGTPPFTRRSLHVSFDTTMDVCFMMLIDTTKDAIL